STDFKCDDCRKQFSTKYNFVRHLKIHTSIKENKFVQYAIKILIGKTNSTDISLKCIIEIPVKHPPNTVHPPPAKKSVLQKDKKEEEGNVITVEAIKFQVDVQLMVNSTGAAGSRIIFLVSVSKSVNRVCQINPEEFTNSANNCKYPPEPFFVGNVSADSMSSSWQNILLINDRPVNFKIDTGAQANIISKKLLDDIYRSGVKAELARMVKAGVIEKVTEPTDRVSPLVIVVSKNGSLRVCLDPQYLNRAIKRPQYNLPTFEDITSKLAGSKYFSVLVAVSAFWQISLDKDSSRFCTFSSPFGRFKFLG
ncbi:hypothetical protein AVEN_201656-1, partial [Araneus ventricosus]